MSSQRACWGANSIPSTAVLTCTSAASAANWPRRTRSSPSAASDTSWPLTTTTLDRRADAQPLLQDIHHLLDCAEPYLCHFHGPHHQPPHSPSGISQPHLRGPAFRFHQCCFGIRVEWLFGRGR